MEYIFPWNKSLQSPKFAKLIMKSYEVFGLQASSGILRGKSNKKQ